MEKRSFRLRGRSSGCGQQARADVLQHDGVELRDRLRRAVVALHHRLARAPLRSVDVAELRGERALEVEHQAVLAPAGEVVQADAQVLERGLVARELARLVPLDEARGHEIAPLAADSARARDPLDGLQIAQARRGLP